MDSERDRDTTPSGPPRDESGSTTDGSRPGTDGAPPGPASRPRPIPGSPAPAPEAPADPIPAGGATSPPAPHAADDPPRRTRRWVLAGLAGLVVGGGAGVGAGYLSTRHRGPRRPPHPPAALLDALATEHRLLADLDASLSAHPQLRGVLTQLRHDHAAHASALENALRAFRAVAASPAGASAHPRPAARSRSALRAGETAAAGAAARRAVGLGGADAVLLASIAACEASHAELLS